MGKKIRVRSLLLGAAFTLLFIGLMSRLYWLQVVEASWLSARAEAMWATERVLPAERGTIYDRNMQVVAGDGKGYTVVVNPRVIDEFGLEREVAAGLSSVLGKPEGELFEQVTSRDGNGNLRIYREVRNQGWKINEETAKKVSDWKEAFVKEHAIKGKNWQGVTLIDQQMRYYPKNTMAAHIIGFIDKDGAARSGLEMSQDSILRGTPGSVQYKRDGEGQKLSGAQPTVVAPVNGKHLVLTIDQTIQHYTESAMKKAYEQFKPKHMTAIAMDPNTMEVLALANFPTFDPNRYWEYDTTKDFKNTAIQSRYEPGSTFKLVTLAGAVEQGIFHPEATYKSGAIRVPGATIHDHNRVGWGEITYLEGVLRSSNVAFVKLGYEQLGDKLLRNYIERFGFMSKTGIDLPGEVQGLIDFYYPSEIAAATYGQGGISVTPLQQLVAYSAIANGGRMMEPYVIKKVLDPETNEAVVTHQPKVLGQVVSEDVAREVTSYLEKVVSDPSGTGKRARIEGYRVAGKTGTANKVVDGKYSTDNWVISFIGFAPVDNPRIVVAVIADEPDLGGNSQRAGEVAAPVFREIVAQSLRYMGVPPESGPSIISSSPLPQVSLVTVPDLHDMQTEAAVKELEARGFTASVLGGGQAVKAQYPPAGEKLSSATNVYVLTVPKEEAPVPNVTGESLRDVVQICALLELKCEAQGEGYVTDQEVADRNGNMTLRVYLKPLREIVPGDGTDGEGSEEDGVNADESEQGSEQPSTGNDAST